MQDSQPRINVLFDDYGIPADLIEADDVMPGWALYVPVSDLNAAHARIAELEKQLESVENKFLDVIHNRFKTSSGMRAHQ